MKLLLQDSYPSWLYSVKKGATTIWEHRDSIKADGSFWSDDMNSWEWKKDEISVRVEIPANTTATIELPNVHSGDLMENNVEAVHAEGVVQVVNQDGNVRIEIRSGVYTFTYPNQMGSLDQFTKNSRVLDLLSSSKAMEVLEKHSPGISEKIGPFSHMKAYTLTRFAKEPTIQLKDVDSILQEINDAILAGKKENNHEYSKA
jgi:alpha-L-rhamnosidase